jgi:co-chaperonin GroES (HSP10)
MKLQALGKTVIIRRDPPDDAMQEKQPQKSRFPRRMQPVASCEQPKPTGVITSIGEHCLLGEKEDLTLGFDVGDHVLFREHSAYGAEVIYDDETDSEYVVLVWLDVMARIEEE